MAKRYFCAFLLLMMLHPKAPAQSGPPSGRKFHLYLLIGQSNMAGRGIITPEHARKRHPRVWMLDKKQEWTRARHPLHFDKPAVAGVGPGLAFGTEMAEADPKIHIGLVPCAVGGTAIDLWQPSRFDSATQTYPYDDALIRIKAAMNQGVIKGILWLQGESDTRPDRLPGYMPKLLTLVDRLRAELKAPALPFVAGELGYFNDTRPPFNKALSTLPDLSPHTAVASAEGAQPLSDGIHFDAASADLMGLRMARAMMDLQDRRGRKKK